MKEFVDIKKLISDDNAWWFIFEHVDYSAILSALLVR